MADGREIAVVFLSIDQRWDGTRQRDKILHRVDGCLTGTDCRNDRPWLSFEQRCVGGIYAGRLLAGDRMAADEADVVRQQLPGPAHDVRFGARRVRDDGAPGQCGSDRLERSLHLQYGRRDDDERRALGRLRRALGFLVDRAQLASAPIDAKLHIMAEDLQVW